MTIPTPELRSSPLESIRLTQATFPEMDRPGLLAHLYRDIGVLGSSSSREESPSAEKEFSFGSLPERFRVRIKEQLKIINCPETQANLIDVAMFCNDDAGKAAREVHRVLSRLGNVSVGGRPSSLVEEHRCQIDRAISLYNGDVKSLKNSRSGTPGWSLEHELLIHLGALINDDKQASEPMKLFSAILYSGLQGARGQNAERADALLTHAAIVLMSAISEEDDKFFLDRGAVAAQELLEKFEPYLPSTKNLLRALANEDLVQQNGVLNYLTAENLSHLFKKYAGPPPYSMLLDFAQQSDRFAPRHLPGSSQFNLAVSTLKLFSGNSTSDEEAMKSEFQAAIIISQAAVEAPLRERLDELPRFNSSGERRRKVSSISSEILDGFLAQITPEKGTYLTSLPHEISALLHDSPEDGRARHRLVLATRIIAPFRPLFEKPEEFAAQVKKLAFKGEHSENMLRALPVVMRCFNPRYRGRNKQAVFFEIGTKNDLNNILRTAQKIANLAPGEEMRSFRVAAELLEVMYRSDDVRSKNNPTKAIKQLYFYMSKMGVEPLPSLYLAYLACINKKTIDLSLTKFIHHEIKNATSPASCLHLIAPMAFGIRRETSKIEYIKNLVGDRSAAPRIVELAEILTEKTLRSFKESSQSSDKQDQNNVEIETSKVSAPDMKVQGEQDPDWLELKKLILKSRYSQLYPTDFANTENPLNIKTPSSRLNFIEWATKARMQLASTAQDNDFQPLLRFDPVRSELLLHSYGVLLREFTWAERSAWPTVGHQAVASSVQQISNLIHKLSGNSLESSPQVVQHGKLQLVIPAPFSNPTEVSIQIGEPPSQAGMPLDYWQTVVESAEMLALRSREMREGAFLKQWSRSLPVQRSELEKKLSRHKDIPSWINHLALHMSGDLKEPGEPNNGDRHLVYGRLYTDIFRALVGNVPEEKLPERFGILGDSNYSLGERANVLIELANRVVRPRGDHIVTFMHTDPKRRDQHEAVVQNLVNSVFHRDKLELIVDSHSLLPKRVARDVNAAKHEKTFATKDIHTHLTRGLPFSLLGYICETCATRTLNPAQTRPNMMFMPYLDLQAHLTTATFVGGTGVIFVRDQDQAPCLLMRGINPRVSLLQTTPASSIYETTVGFLEDLARELDFKRILAPDDLTIGRALTNRPEILYYQKRQYADAQTVELADRDEAFFNHIDLSGPCRVIRDIS